MTYIQNISVFDVVQVQKEEKQHVKETTGEHFKVERYTIMTKDGNKIELNLFLA